MIVSVMLLMGSLSWFVLPVQAQAPHSSAVYATPSPPDDTLKVNVADNHITISDAPANSKLEIYNIVGIKVKEIKIKYPSEEYVVSLPKGYYIIRIGETVRKIVIR